MYGRSGGAALFQLRFQIEVSEEASERLVSFASSSQRSILDEYVAIGACAKIGATAILPFAIDFLRESWVLEPSVIGFSRFGPIASRRVINLLLWIGLLGRNAYEQGEHDKADAAFEALLYFPTTDLDEASELARRAGLACIGMWKPLLSHLPADGEIWYEAARETIRSWIPGPFTPDGEGEQTYIVQWIARPTHPTRC